MICHLQSTTDNSFQANKREDHQPPPISSKTTPNPSALLLEGKFFIKMQNELAPIASYTCAMRRELG